MTLPSSQRTEQLNPDQLEAFVARRAEGPVRMLNLLKFRADGGAESYLEYGAAVAPLLDKVGGAIVYAGSPAELLIGDHDWDLIALVEYPTRQAFLDMVGSPEYQAIEHFRHDALERSVLYATDPAPL
jgi:uncharacterized protein (DUF1330 family)